MEQVPTDNPQIGNFVPPTTQTTAPVSNEQIDPEVTPEPPKKFPPKPLVIIIILGLLIGIGFFVYELFIRGSSVSQRGEISIKSSPESLIGTSVSDNFESNYFNEELWTIFTSFESSRVKINEGKIQLEIPAGYTEYSSSGVTLLKSVEGDFEVQVDSAIIAGGELNGSETALIFHNDERIWNNLLSIYLKKEGIATFIKAYSLYNGVFEGIVSYKTYQEPGPFTLKIARQNDIVTFSEKPVESSTFKTFGTLTSNFYTGTGIITLQVSSFEDNFPGVISTFDNFNLEIE